MNSIDDRFYIVWQVVVKWHHSRSKLYILYLQSRRVETSVAT